MNILENIWWLLVLIGVMILIHELGHYWAARFFDVKVDVFSFGFGPRLFGFRRGETDFRFSLILFGGYVKMAGEHGAEEGSFDPRSFLAKPRWQRLIITFAGPLMNIVLAVGLVTGLYMVRYPKLPVTHSPTVGFIAKDGAAAKAGIREGDRILQIEKHNNPTWEDVSLTELSGAGLALRVLVEREDKSQHAITLTPILDEKNGIGTAGWAEQLPVQLAQVQADMPAERAGLKQRDMLVSANGQRIRSIPKLHEIIRGSEGKPVELVYSRDGHQSTVTVKPTFSKLDGSGRWMIGVQLESPVTFVALPFTQALVESWRQNVRGAGLIVQFLRGILERRMSPKSIEGPIRIAQISTEAAREGPSTFISLMAIVSLNLAIFNLLPIPILDGGAIIMLLIEILMRRDLSLAMKEAVFKVGFVFLMMVVVFVLYSDITKIMPG